MRSLPLFPALALLALPVALEAQRPGADGIAIRARLHTSPDSYAAELLLDGACPAIRIRQRLDTGERLVLELPIVNADTLVLQTGEAFAELPPAWRDRAVRLDEPGRVAVIPRERLLEFRDVCPTIRRRG